MARSIKRLARAAVPRPLMYAYRRDQQKRTEQRFAGLTLEQTFSRIYADNVWGGSAREFSSGAGSHADAIVQPYVRAISDFCRAQGVPLDAVDLGCGDFNVGSRIRGSFARYRARDVVPALIDRNEREFAHLDVDFATLDIVADPWPDGDVVLIRQVLQHLSNDHIRRIVDKLGLYRFAIVTEHLPAAQRFKPNVDQAAGGGVRLWRKSGVVLTAPPFDLRPLEERVLVRVADPEHPGTIVQTTLFRFGD